MAPGRNGIRSLLSAGGEIRMPIKSAMDAQHRTDRIASIVQCGRLRVSKSSIPRPTNHQTGRQKNGIVIVCQVYTEKVLECCRRYGTAATDKGAPTRTPGKLRFVMMWKRRSQTVATENASQWSRGGIDSNCPEAIRAFADLWAA